MKQHSADMITSVVSKATYSAAGATTFLGFTVEEWGTIGVIAGIVIGAATFAFNVWFNMKYRRPKE